MTVTKPQAQMLATLACDSRPIGARQWQPDDVMAEIEKVRGRSLPAVICGVIRCAMDRGAERPSCISSPGSHWSDTRIEQAFVPQTMTAGERCSICSMTEAACRIRHSTDDHEFESAAMAARRKSEGDPEGLTKAIAALKAGIEPTEEAHVKTLKEIKAERPGFAERLAAIEAKHPLPSLQEPQPEPTEGEIA